MTDQTDQSNDTAPVEKTELQMLKERATAMGVSFSNNISVEKLKEKIEAHLRGEAESLAAEHDKTEGPAAEVKLTHGELCAAAQKEHTPLVRIRLSTNDPARRNLPGEVVTIANEYLGSITRFVPIGEATNEGWHVEKVIADHLASLTYLHKENTTKVVRGVEIPTVKTSWQPAFNVTILPKLTREELAALAQRQTAANLIRDN